MVLTNKGNGGRLSFMSNSQNHIVMNKEKMISLPLSVVLKNRLSMWLKTENQLFSSIVEESVSNKQVLFLSHSCLVFILMLVAASFSVFVTGLCLLWWVATLVSCKKGGIK